MKNYICLISLIVASTIFFTPLNSTFADSSKYQKVDLDISNTVIIRGEIGQMGWYYWADATACICWVGGKNASDNFSTASIFDCKKLKAHPKMAEQISNCVDGVTAENKPKEEAKSTPEATLAPESTEKAEKTEKSEKGNKVKSDKK